MSSIDTRPSFFPRSRTGSADSAKNSNKVGEPGRNTPDRAQELLNKTSTDAKVNLGEGVKDFSRIKKAAINAPEQDNSDKIARLKAEIAAGTYEVDYDGLADKILSSEY